MEESLFEVQSDRSIARAAAISGRTCNSGSAHSRWPIAIRTRIRN